MSETVHGPIDPPSKSDPVPSSGLNKLPGTGKVFTQSTTGNAIADAAINSLGNFVGIFIGLGFIIIGILIIVLNNDKVQDAGRKITGAAATINPQLAGAAIATNVLTGKKARGGDIEQVMRAPARKAAAVKKAAKSAPSVKPARQSFSVPVVNPGKVTP